MDTCTACAGKGVRAIKLGRPDPHRDTHKPYMGPWCLYPSIKCGACRGAGKRPSRNNPAMGMRIHLDADGWNTRRSSIEEGNEPYGIQPRRTQGDV